MLYVEKGLRGSNGTCSTLCQFSVTSPVTHKLGPSGAASWVGGLMHTLGPCGSLQRPLLRLRSFPEVRLGVSPAAASIPMDVFNQGFEALFPHAGALGCTVCLTPQLFLPVYLHLNVGPPSPQSPTSPGLPATTLLRVLFAQLPSSAPPTGMDECFFFNSLVVRLPYSSIFCQFWLFFVFKCVVVLLLVVRGGTVCLPMPPSWPKVQTTF